VKNDELHKKLELPNTPLKQEIENGEEKHDRMLLNKQKERKWMNIVPQTM